MAQYTFDPEQLNEIALLSETSSFSLWYDNQNHSFSIDFPDSDNAHWIFDVDRPESPDFLAEITRTVMDFILSEMNTENG